MISAESKDSKINLLQELPEGQPDLELERPQPYNAQQGKYYFVRINDCMSS